MNSSLGSFQRFGVGGVTDVSKIHGASIFRVDLSRANQYSCLYPVRADRKLNLSRNNYGASALFCLCLKP
jgi:hypothetical protein